MNTDRLKFRAWDKEKSSYNYKILPYHGKTGDDDFFAGIMYIESKKDWVNIDDLDNIIIEQCTGLKDKNGKLIYEGDIVKKGDKIFIVKVGVIDIDKSITTGQGCYNETFEYSINGFYLSLIISDIEYRDILSLSDYSDYEIIGNIHKNKELLK